VVYHRSDRQCVNDRALGATDRFGSVALNMLEYGWNEAWRVVPVSLVARACFAFCGTPSLLPHSLLALALALYPQQRGFVCGASKLTICSTAPAPIDCRCSHPLAMAHTCGWLEEAYDLTLDLKR
jgi:hypothetical protein